MNSTPGPRASYREQGTPFAACDTAPPGMGKNGEYPLRFAEKTETARKLHENCTHIANKRKENGLPATGRAFCEHYGPRNWQAAAGITPPERCKIVCATLFRTGVPNSSS